jgi:hypothetical protein
MFRRKTIAICRGILGLVLLFLWQPLPHVTAAVEPDGSVSSAAQPDASSYGHLTPEERRKRVQRIGAISDSEELESELAEASSLDAEIGIPLLRMDALCRVALERLKLQIDDLTSLPAVRRAEEVVSRPEFKARLVALRSKTPAEMVPGFLLVLRESNLDFGDVVLLGNLRQAQKRLREWKKWEDDLHSKAKEHLDAVKTERNPAPGTSHAFEKAEEQRDLLRRQFRAEPVESPPSVLGDSGKILEVIETLTNTPSSQGAKK